MTARILVADGSATSRIMLKVRLAAACYDIVTASTSQQLMQSLRNDQPDMVLLGTALTDSDQISVCNLITQQQPGVTILALAQASMRIQILRAGATAVLSPNVNEQMLLARIRCLLREDARDSGILFSMAEASATFDDGRTGDICLIADSPVRAARWRQLLQSQLNCRFSISDPDNALASAAIGRSADLYMIAADIMGRGDGLRLMSELRSRQGSRDAAFVVAANIDHDDTATFALDLGASDVLPLELSDRGGTEVAMLTLRKQLDRKRRADRRRDAARRSQLWAMTDSLTGLHNRRYARSRLSEIVDTARRQGESFAVLLLDLDHFKSINDSYGHAAGDAVLCDVARRLETIVSDRGVAARFGGEEFLVVLPQANAWHAQRMAEEIRRAIGLRGTLLPSLSGGGEITVTISAGIAICDHYRPDRSVEQISELVLERADQALIAAKSRGRNRVVIAPSEAWLHT
ncbi:diguanylate cyclase [Paracoccus sp. 11-3]|uniref:diguanylate cyclase n=1 Tax=Paracoccus amoyensis TaxID=2760093 RepID=A0A926JBT7_9RHOB|nr:diguanylate cyclase [Paracoccus amoyensis]MBC9245634.1 diguanylate cyclase [Paracoccus amoyensis]